VARELGFLNEPTANWLLKEVGEETPPPVATEFPVWDPKSGELRWRGQVIRCVRVMAIPSSIQRILDAFQAAGWASRIDDPVTEGQHAHQLRQIVFSLNEGLDTIRFHVQEAGRALTWTRT